MFRKKAQQPTIADAADTYENLQSEKGDTSDDSSTSSTSSSSSDAVKSTNRSGKLIKDQWAERFKNIEKDFIKNMAKYPREEVAVVQKRNAEIRAMNNVKNVEE